MRPHLCAEILSARADNSACPLEIVLAHRCVSVGVDRMQRNFEPMRKQVEAWQRSELTDVTAKVVIYEPFVEGKLEVPKHLARTVHDLYFEPRCEDFKPRTIWSFSMHSLQHSWNWSRSQNSKRLPSSESPGDSIVPVILEMRRYISALWHSFSLSALVIDK